MVQESIKRCKEKYQQEIENLRPRRITDEGLFPEMAGDFGEGDDETLANGQNSRDGNSTNDSSDKQE